MIFFEKVSDRLTKRRDTDLPSMRQMKAEIEKPLSPEFQANRSMFRYFPESRQFHPASMLPPSVSAVNEFPTILLKIALRTHFLGDLADSLFLEVVCTCHNLLLGPISPRKPYAWGRMSFVENFLLPDVR